MPYLLIGVLLVLLPVLWMVASSLKSQRALVENDPRFLGRIEKARKSLRAGRGVRLEDL